MKKLLFAFATLILTAIFTCCQNKTTDSNGNSNQKSATVEKETTYFPAIDRYLVNEISKSYTKGEHCVPYHCVVGVDERNADDILVWGDFWVFNYNLSGDTLKTVSGGNHPGLMHIRQTENGYEVTAFDQVADGSDNLPSAKRIFGDKFEAFQAIQSNDSKREILRAEALAEYVKAHKLSATMYQDYGWQAKVLPKQ